MLASPSPKVPEALPLCEEDVIADVASPAVPPKAPSPAAGTPMLAKRSHVAMQRSQMSSSSFCRAALIRANACRFGDRYNIAEDCLLGQGSFGKVNPCVDKLADTTRAVKRICLPGEVSEQDELKNEIDALIALDHPHIVRLVEYFIEGGQVLLVMELLQGPSLGERLAELNFRPGEAFSARCTRHMLKALLCCHCHGIAHNDVSLENFRFNAADRPNATLKMVDFGLSERCWAAFAPARDIWSLGQVLYFMLAGVELFPRPSASGRKGCSRALVRSISQATDREFVPSRIASLEASKEASDLLSAMLEASTTLRVTAKDALNHPFVHGSYARTVDDSCAGGFPLVTCMEAFREFERSPRLRQLGLMLVAHFLNDNEVGAIRWQFRALARDGWQISEHRLREALEEAAIEVPADFDRIFAGVDTTGTGSLDYIEFLSAALTSSPAIVCRKAMLRAVFHFLDKGSTGVVSGQTLHALLPEMPEGHCVEIIHEACGSNSMTYSGFEDVMAPDGWEESVEAGAMPAASWARLESVGADGWEEAALPPEGMEPGPATDEEQEEEEKEAEAEAEAHTEERRSSKPLMAWGSEKSERPEKPQRPKIESVPSVAFAVRQMPGFHLSTARPAYASQPVSNVVLGLVQGTSGYARRAVQARCVELVDVRGVAPACGAFLFMPNPKYHWTPDCVFNAEKKIRIVAWWIHPDFCDEMVAWTKTAGSSATPSAGTAAPGSGCCAVGSCSPDRGDARRPSLDAGVGAPGDFGLSSVAKPDGYLHTCRELGGEEHVAMLDALVGGTKRYLERLLGGAEAVSAAHVSAGFHYPVRPQYSTLHLQCRVNSGDVCPGGGRGVDLFRLLQRLRADPQELRRDDETLFYEATANLRGALLGAAREAGAPIAEVGPRSLVLG